MVKQAQMLMDVVFEQILINDLDEQLPVIQKKILQSEKNVSKASLYASLEMLKASAVEYRFLPMYHS